MFVDNPQYADQIKTKMKYADQGFSVVLFIMLYKLIVIFQLRLRKT